MLGAEVKSFSNVFKVLVSLDFMFHRVQCRRDGWLYSLSDSHDDGKKERLGSKGTTSHEQASMQQPRRRNLAISFNYQTSGKPQDSSQYPPAIVRLGRKAVIQRYNHKALSIYSEANWSQKEVRALECDKYLRVCMAEHGCDNYFERS